MTSPFKKMVLKSSVLLFIALIISRFFGYLFHSLFAKSFSTSEYGLFVYLWSLSMLIAGIGLLGLGFAVSRFIAYSRGSGDESKVRDYFKTGLKLTVFLSLICVLFVLLAVKFSIIPLDSVSTLFVCALIVVHGIGFYFGSVISGYRRPEVANINIAVGQVLKFLFLIAVVYFASGFNLALLSFVLAFALGYLLNVIYFYMSYGFGGKFRFALAGELAKFGVFIVFADTANNLLSWASIFLIQYFIGYSLVAVFNAAYLVSTIGLVLFTAVVEVYSPVVTELLGRKDYGKCSRLSSHLLESFFLLFLPPFLVLYLFSSEVLSIFFTHEYVQAALVLRILLFSSFIFGVAMLLRRFIIADGRPSVDARIIISSAIVNVVLNYALIPYYGINGAALASLCSSALMLLLSIMYIGDKIRLSLSKIRLLKILAATIVSSIAVYYVKALIESSIISLFASTIILCVIYALVLLLLKSLREEDVEMVEMVSAKIPLPAGIKTSIIKLLEYGISP